MNIVTSPTPKDLSPIPPYIHAQFAQAAYKDYPAQDLPLGWQEAIPQDKTILEALAHFLHFGYRARVFVHHARRELVIAHAGTSMIAADKIKAGFKRSYVDGFVKIIEELNQTSLDVLTDLQCVLQNGDNEHTRAAIAYSKLWDDLVVYAGYTKIMVGHSLGGWLAQVSACLLKAAAPQNHYPVVVFDAPGAQYYIDNFEKHAAQYNSLSADSVSNAWRELSIQRYIYQPNLINGCGAQVESYRTAVLSDSASEQFFKPVEQFNQLCDSILDQSSETARTIELLNSTAKTHDLAFLREKLSKGSVTWHPKIPALDVSEVNRVESTKIRDQLSNYFTKICTALSQQLDRWIENKIKGTVLAKPYPIIKKILGTGLAFFPILLQLKPLRSWLFTALKSTLAGLGTLVPALFKKNFYDMFSGTVALVNSSVESIPKLVEWIQNHGTAILEGYDKQRNQFLLQHPPRQQSLSCYRSPALLPTVPVFCVDDLPGPMRRLIHHLLSLYDDRSGYPLSKQWIWQGEPVQISFQKGNGVPTVLLKAAPAVAHGDWLRHWVQPQVRHWQSLSFLKQVLQSQTLDNAEHEALLGWYWLSKLKQLPQEQLPQWQWLSIDEWIEEWSPAFTVVPGIGTPGSHNDGEDPITAVLRAHLSDGFSAEQQDGHKEALSCYLIKISSDRPPSDELILKFGKAPHNASAITQLALPTTWCNLVTEVIADHERKHQATINSAFQYRCMARYWFEQLWAEPELAASLRLWLQCYTTPKFFERIQSHIKKFVEERTQYPADIILKHFFPPSTENTQASLPLHQWLSDIVTQLHDDAKRELAVKRLMGWHWLSQHPLPSKLSWDWGEIEELPSIADNTAALLKRYFPLEARPALLDVPISMLEGSWSLPEHFRAWCDRFDPQGRPLSWLDDCLLSAAIPLLEALGSNSWNALKDVWPPALLQRIAFAYFLNPDRYREHIQKFSEDCLNLKAPQPDLQKLAQTIEHKVCDSAMFAQWYHDHIAGHGRNVSLPLFPRELYANWSNVLNCQLWHTALQPEGLLWPDATYYHLCILNAISAKDWDHEKWKCWQEYSAAWRQEQWSTIAHNHRIPVLFEPDAQGIFCAIPQLMIQLWSHFIQKEVDHSALEIVDALMDEQGWVAERDLWIGQLLKDRSKYRKLTATLIKELTGKLATSQHLTKILEDIIQEDTMTEYRFYEKVITIKDGSKEGVKKPYKVAIEWLAPLGPEKYSNHFSLEAEKLKLLRADEQHKKLVSQTLWYGLQVHLAMMFNLQTLLMCNYFQYQYEVGTSESVEDYVRSTKRAFLRDSYQEIHRMYPWSCLENFGFSGARTGQFFLMASPEHRPNQYLFESVLASFVSVLEGSSSDLVIWDHAKKTLCYKDLIERYQQQVFFCAEKFVLTRRWSSSDIDWDQLARTASLVLKEQNFEVWSSWKTWTDRPWPMSGHPQWSAWNTAMDALGSKVFPNGKESKCHYSADYLLTPSLSNDISQIVDERLTGVQHSWTTVAQKLEKELTVPEDLSTSLLLDHELMDMVLSAVGPHWLVSQLYSSFLTKEMAFSYDDHKPHFSKNFEPVWNLAKEIKKKALGNGRDIVKLDVFDRNAEEEMLKHFKRLDFKNHHRKYVFMAALAAVALTATKQKSQEKLATMQYSRSWQDMLAHFVQQVTSNLVKFHNSPEQDFNAVCLAVALAQYTWQPTAMKLPWANDSQAELEQQPWVPIVDHLYGGGKFSRRTRNIALIAHGIGEYRKSLNDIAREMERCDHLNDVAWDMIIKVLENNSGLNIPEETVKTLKEKLVSFFEACFHAKKPDLQYFPPTSAEEFKLHHIEDAAPGTLNNNFWCYVATFANEKEQRYMNYLALPALLGTQEAAKACYRMNQKFLVPEDSAANPLSLQERLQQAVRAYRYAELRPHEYKAAFALSEKVAANSLEEWYAYWKGEKRTLNQQLTGKHEASYEMYRHSFGYRFSPIMTMQDGQQFKRIRVQADGNCFYRAVAAQLKQAGKTDSNGQQYTPQVLRHLAVDNVNVRFRDTIENSLSELQDPAFRQRETVDHYVHDHRQTGTWADDGTIQALAAFLDLHIVIYNADNLSATNINLPTAEEQRTVIHLYYTGDHYDALEQAVSAEDQTVLTVQQSRPLKGMMLSAKQWHQLNQFRLNSFFNDVLSDKENNILYRGDKLSIHLMNNRT